MAQQPTEYGVSLDTIKESYGASSFNTALARYIIHLKHPQLSQRQVRNAAEDFHIPFHKVSVFHRIKFISHDPFSINPSADIVVNSIHSEPSCLYKYGKVIPAQFDTAIIKWKMEGVGGIKGEIFYIKLQFFEQALTLLSDYCMGQVHCIFSLPAIGVKSWFSNKPPLHILHMLNGSHRSQGFTQVIIIGFIRYSGIVLMVFNRLVLSQWSLSSRVFT